MSAQDLVAAVVIAGAALALLVRTLRRTGGGCHGCSQGCRTSPSEKGALVRLGRPTGER